MIPQATYRAANAVHAEHLANAKRSRLAATQLHPRTGRPRVQIERHRVAAVLASLVMAAVLATAVSAAVNPDQSTPAAPNAAGASGGGGGAAVLKQ